MSLRNSEKLNSVPPTLHSHRNILSPVRKTFTLNFSRSKKYSIKIFCLTTELPAGCINVNFLTFQFHQAPDSIFSIFLQSSLMNHLYLYFRPCYLGQTMPLIFSLSFTWDEEKCSAFLLQDSLSLRGGSYHCCKTLAYKCHHFVFFCH